MFHLLYFSLQGPHGWGVQRDHKAKPHELAELRFPLTSLKRIRWQEDDERPERDEFYAESRREFSVPPDQIEILREGEWMPIRLYYRDHYWDDYRG